MALQIYTSDKTSPRGFQWIWFIRLFQIVLTIVVLGVTAASVTSFHDIGCNAPPKLNFNLAVSVLGLLGVIYFLFATGPREVFRILPWFIWGQIFLDGLLLLFWLAASASSTYNCSDLCSACGYAYDEVEFDNLFCLCSVVVKRETSPAPKGLTRSLESRRTSTRSGGSSAGAKVGIDSIMTVLFAITLASIILWFVRTRNASNAATTNTTAPAPANSNVEAGVPLQPKQDTYTTPQPTYAPTAAQPSHGGGPEMQSQPMYGQPAPEYPGQVPFGQQPQQAPGYPSHEMQGGHMGPTH